MNTMNRGILSTILALIFPMGFLRLWVDDPDTGGDDGTGGDDAGPGSDATSGTVGTGNDDRLRLLDSINDNNDRARAEEMALVNDDGSTEPFVAPAIEDEGQGGTPPVVVAPVVEPPAPTVTKIKVNGEEVELTPDLIAKAQKIASADKYLEDASRAAKTTTAAPAPVAETPPPPTQGVGDRSEDDRALVRAIQIGTEEEALAALQKLRSTQPTLSAEEIGRIADERLNYKEALSWFNTEYKDLVADEQLHSIVLARDADLVKAGDKRTYMERYEAIGNEVREWRDEMVKKFGPAAAPAPAPAVDKVERKQTAPKVPVVANAKAKPPGNDEDADEDPSSVIANMAKSRGGPQWARG